MIQNIVRSLLVLAWLGAGVAVTGCNNKTVEVGKMNAADLPSEDQGMALAASGDLNKVKSLVEANPDVVKQRGDKQRTMLHAAASNNQTAVVSYLLQKGADPTISDDNGETPADAARQEGHLDLAKTLQAAAQKAGGAAPAQ